MNEYSDIFEAHMDSGKVDSRNRPIGYIVKFRNDGKEFSAWVQNSRKNKKGEWADFGPSQRGKVFSNQKSATEWAYRTAKQRIAGLN